MTSLVPDYLINPVLRQARRLSDNFFTSEPEAAITPRLIDHSAIDSGDGDSSMGDDDKFEVESATLVGSGGPREDRSLLPERTELRPEEGLHALHISSPSRPVTAIGDGPSQPIAIGVTGRSTEQIVATSLPASFYGGVELPEDDGMGNLRRRIIDIQTKRITPNEKAKLVHGLLMEGYTRSQIARQVTRPARPHTPSSPVVSEQAVAAGPLDSFKFWQGVLGEQPPTQRFELTEDDLRPTYVPLKSDGGMILDNFEDEDIDRGFLGCEHYRRNVKLQCFTCERWYTCRLCHNEAEDHTLPRRETRHMLCMLCGHPQKVGEVCVKCGESAAQYYCGICKLWNDDPSKRIYHCPDCGICRVGEGLGKDFVHCKVGLPFQYYVISRSN
jgi:uncharacterized CHY-type Zn-finger protein